jgi:hypothetical protein
MGIMNPVAERRKRPILTKSSSFIFVIKDLDVLFVVRNIAISVPLIVMKGRLI